MPYFCSVVVVLTILYAFPSVSSTIPRLDSDRQNRNPLLSPGVPVELIAADTRENAALFNRLLKGALTMNKHSCLRLSGSELAWRNGTTPDSSHRRLANAAV
ncbi:unnamed protein product [Toxocara canis]|uniref:Secreted protein n=1 Tax=Toxocara canis TaxID=6265 RepID=A0A183UHE6_TOXCA|nr:unnamed protein product [Toxocara canis]